MIIVGKYVLFLLFYLNNNMHFFLSCWYLDNMYLSVIHHEV